MNDSGASGFAGFSPRENLERFGQPLVGGFPKPKCRFFFIFLNSNALHMAATEIELRSRMALLRRFTIPEHGQVVALTHAPAELVANAEVELRGFLTFFRS